MIFSGNIIGQVFLTDQKLEMNMPQFFKTTFIANSENIKLEKKIGGVRIEQWNQIEKTEELVAGYQGAECLWNVLSPLYKNRNLWQLSPINLCKKFDRSGKLFSETAIERGGEKWYP